MPHELLVRTSERTQFKRCRQAWWWAYVDELKPAREATPLRFGTLIHAALEQRYPKGTKRGPHPAEVFVELYAKSIEQSGSMYARDDDGEALDMGKLGITMLEGYIDTYGEDDRYEVLGTEQTFRVPVLNRSGKHLFTYVGKLDGIWRDLSNDDVLVNDFKTAASISTGHLPLDEQSGAYFTFGPDWMINHGLLAKGTVIDHILFNFMRKALPDDRPRNAAGHYLNANGSVSKRQPAPLFHREKVYRDPVDRLMVRQRATAEVREMRMVRRGRLSAYKNPGPFTCMGCGYKDMCELHETGGDWQAYRDATTVPWEPYADHEIENDEKR